MARERYGSRLEVQYQPVMQGPDHPVLPEVQLDGHTVMRGQIPSVWSLANLVERR